MGFSILALLTPLAVASPAEAPILTLRYASQVGRILVVPPEGEHVNESAPALLSTPTVSVSGYGSLDWARVPVHPGDRVEAQIPVCRDNGTECRLIVGVAMVPDARSGRIVLGPVEPAHALPVSATSPVRIYDFTAEWCPPCQQMAVEVLHDPDDAPLLAPFELVAVDADDASSWELKSRYQVGGYPTLIAVDASGNEVDRFLGYPSETALRGWLSSLQTVTPLTMLESGPPSGVDPADAATTALRFARIGKIPLAEAWLAAAAPTSRAAVEARLLLDPTPEDARWMLANAADGEWIVDAVDALPELWPEFAPRVAGLDPAMSASCLAAYADALDEGKAGGPNPAAAQAARIGAATLVWDQLSHELAHDRGFIIDLTDLLAGSGNLPRALGILDEYATAFPEEFTWDFAAARLLSEAGRNAEALPRAQAALKKADGDQRFRAVVRLGRIMGALGRGAEAIGLLDGALMAIPPPGELDVRTHRYRKEAETLKAELEGSAKATP